MNFKLGNTPPPINGETHYNSITYLSSTSDEILRLIKQPQNDKRRGRYPERGEGSYERFFGHCPQNDGLSQQGRSMLEMLGVLGIMALLMLGGIWGYQRAINSDNFNLNQACLISATPKMRDKLSITSGVMV